ncbi:MAG: hypothetical protein IT211_07500 [Armatimonadetes bacterium]|nr:hypothetical protein [Armatimonadota bacterium]
MNFSTYHLAAHAAYEHVQIDMRSGAYPDGVHPIHRYPDPGISVSAVVSNGGVVDLQACDAEGGLLETISPDDPDDDDGNGGTPHAMLRRAWLLPHRRQTLHAESWVNDRGEGFVDLFLRAR